MREPEGGVLANLEATLAWVREQNAGNLEAARLSRAGHGLPHRAALNHLTGRFLTDHYLTVARWAQWASELVRDWPENVSTAVIDPATADEGVQLAELINDIARIARELSREHDNWTKVQALVGVDEPDTAANVARRSFPPVACSRIPSY